MVTQLLALLVVVWTAGIVLCLALGLAASAGDRQQVDADLDAGAARLGDRERTVASRRPAPPDSRRQRRELVRREGVSGVARPAR